MLLAHSYLVFPFNVPMSQAEDCLLRGLRSSGMLNSVRLVVHAHPNGAKASTARLRKTGDVPYLCHSSVTCMRMEGFLLFS